MKIAIADNNSRKFTDDLIKHWEKNHEVKYELGASEFLAPWADLYYIDEWDNNIHYLFNWYLEHPKVKKPIMVVRPLDWTVWIGLVRDQRIIDWVDKTICIAPHIEKELRTHADFGDKLKLIRPGVNLDKFTLKVKKTDGFQLGMVLGDMWKYKNHMGGLDIFTTLYLQDNRWKLHVRGQHENGTFDPINWNYYLETRDIQDAVQLYPQVENMNEWYENIDILLHPGQKEGFCYAIGEAMAKGIPVVSNDFYGSKDIWPWYILYQTSKNAIHMIENPDRIPENRNPKLLRQYIQDNYSLEKQLKETDEWIGIS